MYLTLARGGSRLFVQISQETTNSGDRRGGQVGNAGRQGVKSVMELGGGRRREGPPLALVSSVLTKETEQKASQLVPARAKALFLRSHPGNQGSMQASFICGHSKPCHVSLILNTHIAVMTC